MEASVLVLDIGYKPLRCTNWQQAIVWVLEKIVEVVDEHPDRYIHTPNWAVKMPSVVRFLKPISRKRAVKFSRHNIYARDRGKCAYCGVRISRDRYTYDHVLPRAQGGQTSWTNVVTSCVFCNQKKGGRTPEQAGMHLLTQPIRPKKLPEMPFAMKWNSGMPESWKDFLRDAVYWTSELENENKSE